MAQRTKIAKLGSSMQVLIKLNSDQHYNPYKNSPLHPSTQHFQVSTFGDIVVGVHIEFGCGQVHLTLLETSVVIVVIAFDIGSFLVLNIVVVALLVVADHVIKRCGQYIFLFICGS